MYTTCTITPDVLAAIATSWSEVELHAAAAVLVDLLQDRHETVPVSEVTSPPDRGREAPALSLR